MMAKGNKPTATPTEVDLTSFRRFAARHNANRHLVAYVLTRNPKHILDAMTEFIRLGVAPDETMRKNWEHFRTAKTPRRRTRTHAVRLIDIWLDTLFKCNSIRIPPKVDGAILAELARAHNLKVGHIKKLLSELRETEANSTRPGATPRTPPNARKVTLMR